jgi:hypothetical protein
MRDGPVFIKGHLPIKSVFNLTQSQGRARLHLSLQPRLRVYKFPGIQACRWVITNLAEQQNLLDGFKG